MTESDSAGVAPSPHASDRTQWTRSHWAQEALRLAEEEGMSSRKISQHLRQHGHSVSHPTIIKYLREAREEIPWQDIFDRQTLRTAQAGRLEQYVQIVMEEVKGGRADPLQAIDRLLKIEDRWAKLAGLDAPTRTVTESPREVEPDPEVMAALAALPREDDNHAPTE